MNKTKLLLSATSRVLFNTFMVIAMVVLASLIGVGGAALWIYGRPETTRTATKLHAPQLKAEVAETEARSLPKLSPVQADDETPAQLTPARYVPSESEIATISDTPRYTYVSYDGGRQQAHLRVNTVLSTVVPAPLAPVAATNDDIVPTPDNDRTALSDPASHYITNAEGRVIGIDGRDGAAVEARAQQVTVAGALPVQQTGTEPEVRIASPVAVRKAVPVDDETVVPDSGSFSVQSELAREDDRPVLRAQPVAHVTRSSRLSMFGASAELRSFNGN